MLPGIRSIKEWLPTVEAATWYALLAPANTPRQIVDTLNAEIKWVLEQHDVREGFATLAVRPEHTTPEGLREVLLQDIERIQDLERRGQP